MMLSPDNKSLTHPQANSASLASKKGALTSQREADYTNPPQPSVTARSSTSEPVSIASGRMMRDSCLASHETRPTPSKTSNPPPDPGAQIPTKIPDATQPKRLPVLSAWYGLGILSISVITTILVVLLGCGIGTHQNRRRLSEISRTDDQSIMTTSTFILGISMITVIALLVWWCRAKKSTHVEVDHSRSDHAVTRQRYKPSKVMKRPDAIVIGSGPGGLTTAALLAKQGKRVLVLEQHDRAGGGLHCFEDHGFEWDTGFHYMGDVQEDNPLRGILKHLTGGNVEWKWMADNEFSKGAYDRVQFGDEVYDFLPGSDNFFAVLKSACPTETEAIDGIREELDKMHVFTLYLIWKTLPFILRWCLERCLRRPIVRLLTVNTLDVLHRHTHDEKLIALFTYIWGCYSATPKESSWGLHASVVNHYKNGAAYPVGGPEKLVRGFIETIEAGGGQVLVNASVEGIIFNSTEDRAMGVSMKKTGQEILSPVVISTAGVYNTFERLVPPKVAKNAGWVSISNKCAKPGRGHVTLFCGFNVTGKEAGLPGCNHWIFPKEYDHEANAHEFFANPEEFLAGGEKFPYIAIAFPSEKDPSFLDRHPGKSTASILLEVDTALFLENEEALDGKPHHRGEEHDNLKEAFADRLLEIFFKNYPQLEEHLEHYMVGTPLCANHFLGRSYGETYSLTYSTEYFATKDEFLDPQTPIEGLYLAGQDVTGNGIGGAMIGGIYCASRIVNPWVMWYGLVKDIGIRTLITPPADTSPKYKHFLTHDSKDVELTPSVL